MHRRFALLLLALAAAGCHGFFGQRTGEEETDLKNFAEARQRAATYYDGHDYARAAAQFKQALSYRPDHVPTKMGYAYSLMYLNKVSSLQEAERQFDEIGQLRDPKQEVKRVFGLGMTYRNMAAHYHTRSMTRDQKGELKGAADDLAKSRDFARKGLASFQRVIDLDQVLSGEQSDAIFRVSASLTPDAHVGMAACEVLLIDRDKPEELDAQARKVEDHLAVFAQIAENSRRFWEQRRERLLVSDPLRDDMPGAKQNDAADRQRYEERIANTIRQEVVVRQALFETYLYMNRFAPAIEEADQILRLDPTQDDVLLMRGKAYTWLEPPNYRAALRDLKEYRDRMPKDQLTDALVKINRDIRDLESRLAAEEAKRAEG